MAILYYTSFILEKVKFLLCVSLILLEITFIGEFMNLKKLTALAGLCVLVSACDLTQNNNGETAATGSIENKIVDELVTVGSCLTKAGDTNYDLIDSFTREVVKSQDSKVRSKMMLMPGKASYGVMTKVPEQVDVVTEKLTVNIYRDYAGLVFAEAAVESSTKSQVDAILSEKTSSNKAVITCVSSEGEEFTYTRSRVLENVSKYFGNEEGRTFMDSFNGTLAGKGVSVKISSYVSKLIKGAVTVEYNSDASDTIFSKK
jgi:hypothetical protein